MITDTLRFARPWLTFGGCVLIVAVMGWAQQVLVPIALAALLTFLVSPVVTPLQRRIGRVPAVLAVVTLTVALLAAAAWGVTQQVTALVHELPQYRENIRQKIRDVRLVGRGGSVDTLQKTVQDIQHEFAQGGGTPPRVPDRVVVEDGDASGIWALPVAVMPWVQPLADAGLVVVLVVFMLLERQQLRDRVIRLFGRGQLPLTTKAFDEAGRRVSHYLLVQSLINAFFGCGVGVGLFFIGVPHALLWGFLAGTLRFIPYVGTWIATIAPLLVALAVLEGWTRPLLVATLFLGLELFTNLALETIFYAGAAGVSEVGLLVAIAFWTWLWGPVGLLLATPLTVCLVVVGRHVPNLEFITTLLSDAPVLDADVRYYQRLLAGDRAEALDLIDELVRAEPETSPYDVLMLPALNYAVRDRLDGRIDEDDEQAIVDATRALLAEVTLLGEERAAPAPMRAQPLRILGCAVDGEPDALALAMLAQLVEPARLAVDGVSGARLASEVIARAKDGAYRVVCVAHLPPCPPSRAVRLVKRLRAALPDVKIVVGAWAPAELAPDDLQAFEAAGADHAATRLADTAAALTQLAQDLAQATPGAA